MKKKFNRSLAYSSQGGFTLVELLIVIVIIGILAGVVIGVLNPIQQQNRAKDGITRAQLDKVALSTKSLFVSSPRTTDRVPTGAEFAGGLGNIKAGTTCTGTDPAAAAGSCLFEINNQALPVTCSAASSYTGASTSACKYVYYRDPAGIFRVGAMGAATPAALFVYTYTETATGSVTEGFYSCPTATTIDLDPATNGCTLMN